MIILRNRTTIAHLRFYKRDIINPYTKRTLVSKHINMDSGNNQQKKEGEKQFSIQPIQDNAAVDPKFAAHQAHPGPAMTKNMPPEQGTKEERQARKEELNK
ncbi:hypothetical protein HDV63DRAFT_372439 [Trichoderma sp. SZMC 28014]